MSFNSLTYAGTIPVESNRLKGKGSGPFIMSYAFDPRPMSLSIKQVGLVNPPILREDTRGEMDIVTGFRRIDALMSLGWREVPCRILPESVSPLECLLLNLHDNLTTRTFNDVEKSMVLNRLRRFLPEKEILELYMPLLNLRPRMSLLNYYWTLEELEPSVKIGVAQKTLSPRTVRALQDKDHDTRVILAEWIEKFNFNFNQQQQFIEYIEDICIRDGVYVIEIFEDATFMKSILAEEELNPPQKGKSVLEYLRRRRFPRLSRTESNFRERLSRLRLPKGIGVHHPPNFEGSDYLLEIAFKDGRMLMEKIDALAETRDLVNLFDDGQGDEAE